MILCNGEALIDMIPEQSAAGDLVFTPLCGGSIFNTSIALGRLGTATGLHSGLSNDLFGRQLERALLQSHVDTSLIIKSNSPTTLAFVELMNGHASYTFYDENTAGRLLYKDQLPVLSSDISTLYFGGISLCSEPGANHYLALAQREAEARVIVLDPNIRPSFISDERRYRSRIQQMLAIADIVKVSDEDLNWLIPGNNDLKNKAWHLTGGKASVVIVTRGSDGVLAWCKDGSELRVPSHRVMVVDTVGAGDTFNAGVLASLDDQKLLTKSALAGITSVQLEQALQLGAQVAAVTVSRAGANPPWRNEL